MTDRYTKTVLTVIAVALVYLCVVFTPLPSAFAQAPRIRPGDPTGPGEMVIVGWRVPASERVGVTVADTVNVSGAVKVSGSVSTERGSGKVDRVMIAGWEEQSTADNPGRNRFFSAQPAVPQALPVTSLPR